MKTYLYWQKNLQNWLYSLSELEINSSNLLEYHGTYEITMKNGEQSRVAQDEYGNAMVEYKGELYILRTPTGIANNPVPYIIYNLGGTTATISLPFNVKKIK